MKKFIKVLSVFVLMALFCAPASAQISFGVKGGANFSNINLDYWNSSNETGWYVGPTLELMMPVVGLGIEGSLLYSRISSDFSSSGYHQSARVDYLTLPINLKYKLPLPVIRPFIFAGPEFCVKVDDHIGDALVELWDESFNGADLVINVGLGVELFKKLQVSASYNRGVTNSFKHVDSKVNNWRVGVGLYF